MTEQANNQGSPPIKTFRAGRVQAAVFENKVERDGQTDVHHSVKVDKRYQDKDGNWQSTMYFYPDELSKVLLVVGEANRFLNLHDTDPRDQST